MLPDVALTVALPAPIPLAKPPAAMLATEGALDAHTTEAVTFCMLPSLKVPVAWNCCVVPNGIETFVGAMTMDTRTG